VDELAAIGVRRISVGSALSRAAWGGFIRAVEAIAAGRFDTLGEAASFAQLNEAFR
jgi:2-methylisocitrate lyase-like PEP mutase family enzyme